MNMVKLFGKPLRVNKASQDRKAGPSYVALVVVALGIYLLPVYIKLCSKRSVSCFRRFVVHSL